jgi:outer membrane protein OmpA-like peptidoglycan-associated protein
VGVGTALLAAPAHAEDFHDPEDLPEVTAQMAADSVAVFDLDGSVATFSPDGSVEIIEEQVRTVGEETVVTLSSDILFEPTKAELPATAPDNLAEVLTDAPQGAGVTVTGHTDSVGDDASNQLLSEQRAQAVATAIATARPDLVLTVQGRGETEPVATETTGDAVDAGARAKNRRVEIRYVG